VHCHSPSFDRPLSLSENNIRKVKRYEIIIMPRNMNDYNSRLFSRLWGMFFWRKKNCFSSQVGFMPVFIFLLLGGMAVKISLVGPAVTEVVHKTLIPGLGLHGHIITLWDN
jgi:hypothetical protein